MKYFLSILVLFVTLGPVISQTPNIWVKGVVTAKTTGKGIPYAQIASFGTYSIFATDSVGRFSVSLPGNDSIRILAMGFASRNISLNNHLPTKNLTIELTESSYDLNEVTVYSISANEHLQQYMPSDIKMGYVNPLPPGLRPESGGGGPIGLIYNKFNNRERSKAKVRELMVTEKAQARMTKVLVAELTGLEPPELDRFYVYCNANINIAPNHPDSFIRARILDAYVKYTAQNNANENKDGQK